MTDQPANSPATGTEAADPKLVATHQAVFHLWLPLDDLALPPDVKADIAKIAGEVCSNLFAGLCASPAQKALLQGMTSPNLLPFYEQIKSSTNLAVIDFGKNGFGGMDVKNRKALFSWLFDGPGCPASAQIAMALREIYLSTIWEAPLALPLTETGESPVFVSNPAIWAKFNYPKLPASRLAYNPQTNVVAAKQGKIDYLIIGSGPGGAMTAHELQQAGKNVVLIERGNYIVWGSMNTMSCADLMFQRNQAFTSDHGIVIRSGEAVGGGSTVNVDLAFSPLESTILMRIQYWISQGWVHASDYSIERLAAAYQYVREKLETREVEQDELNQDNLVLWRGSQAFGITPSLYHLNRFATGESPSPVTQKRDAARQLLRGPLQDVHNPLSLIPNADVDEILFSGQNENLKAAGVSFIATEPWTAHGNACVDPSNLKIKPGTRVKIYAENVIVAAGTIGSTRLLLKTVDKNPALKNPRIGAGLILHPSVPLIGLFENDQINLLEGLDSATFVDTFGMSPGFILETMTGLPAYGAVLIPGSGKQVFKVLRQFNQCAGFGVMLVDTPSGSNRISLDKNGNVVIQYSLQNGDKDRFRKGVALAARLMLLAGAKEVVVPTNENWKGSLNFDPMDAFLVKDMQDVALLQQNLNFIPNRTIVTSAHLQATNKMGASADSSVVSKNQRLWNMTTRQEIPNLYVMDSSIFPTSVGANPMQSIYTFARIFSERLLGSTGSSPVPYSQLNSGQRRNAAFAPEKL
jgi:hypothetical protein